MLKNRLCYLIVLLGSFLFFVFYNGYISYYVLLVTLALPWVSLLISLPGVFGVRLKFLAETGQMNKGESVPLRIIIDNRLPIVSGRARVQLLTHNTLTGETQEETFTFTASRRPMQVMHRLSSPHCGQILCQLRKLRVCDYMGIFSFPLPLSRCPAYRVTVYPAVYHPKLSVEQVFLANEGSETYSQTKSGDDPSELFDLREYREGDKIARIHWKLSQKTGDLLVREFGLPISDRVLFVLDPNGSGKEVDLLLDVFATLSHYLLFHELIHHVAFWKGKEQQFILQKVTDLDTAQPVLDALLQNPRDPDPKAIPHDGLPGGIAHVLYLCCTPDTGVADSLRQRFPVCRFSILLTSDQPVPAEQSLPVNAELTAVPPGAVTEALNGFRL